MIRFSYAFFGLLFPLMAFGNEMTGLDDINSRHNTLLDQIYDPINVSPESYAEQYIGNQYAADDKYKGKLITFRGVVSKVAPGLDGEPEIKLVEGRFSKREVTLRLYTQQIVAHDRLGYRSVPLLKFIKDLPARETVIANCYSVGLIGTDVVADRCLVYLPYVFMDLYNVE